MTRESLSAAADGLLTLASSVESFEAGVRGELRAINSAFDTIAPAWKGPIPDATTSNIRRWVSEVYEAGNVLAPIPLTLRNWAQSAWNLSDLLPPDGDHGDPDEAPARAEVAALWNTVCNGYADGLVRPIRQLELMARADVGGAFDGLFDMFETFGDFFGDGFDALRGLAAWFADSTTPVGWSDWMAGQSPHREDFDLALLSNDVYDADGWNDPNRTIGNGWRRVSPSDLPAGLTQADFENGQFGNDMRAALYTDGSGHYVLAFAGTDSVSDALTDVYQGVGLSTHQYEHGRRLAGRLHDAYGDDLVMTGHSLGGGVASYAALSTGNAAVTFNAAGLSDANMENVGLHWKNGRTEVARSGQIRAYHVDSDVLTNVQESADDIPDAVGTRITLANPIEQPSDWFWLVPPVAAGAQGAHSVDMHLMDNVLGGMSRSEISFSTDYTVVTSTGTETRSAPQTYPGGWFTK